MISTIVFIMHLFVYGFGEYLPFQSVDWLGWYPLMDSTISSATQVSTTYTLKSPTYAAVDNKL